MKKIFVILLSVLCGCKSIPYEPDKRWFVDEDLVYERGSALSSEYLQKYAPDFLKELKDILPWVVRIEVKHSFADGGYSSNHGTGLILKEGKVLTANHVVTQRVSGPVEIVLTLIDGRIFPATIERQGELDWAFLQMDVGTELSLLESPVTLADAKAGETAVFLGYPARIGLDKKGQVQSFNKGMPSKGVPADQLLPMLVVATAADLEAMKLDPLAGFPPVGGMSGGPIFNLQGQLIAVQHAVSKTSDDATGKVLYYKIDATPVQKCL